MVVSVRPNFPAIYLTLLLFESYLVNLGECSRMRYFVTNAEFVGNHVENCGVHDFELGGMKSGVNGELLYIG